MQITSIQQKQSNIWIHENTNLLLLQHFKDQKGKKLPAYSIIQASAVLFVVAPIYSVKAFLLSCFSSMTLFCGFGAQSLNC